MPYAGPSDPASSATATATRPAHHHRRTRSSSNFSDERGPGAFAPLGQLPRLNKKAVFHINDNDDDNANDDDPRPSYPTYASPYSPINSLRLSMNTGKFSPSINPPSRIDIPPLEPPTSVPFPTSSPISPSDGPSPFFPSHSNFSSKHTSKTSSPSLPRTPSTPVILSNGKPLKSSLKSSSSTPNIADLPMKHMRAQSAPSTPSTIKNVHFADKDSGLETVRVYNRSGKPASLSKPQGEETETETEAESSFPFPLLPTSPVSQNPAPTLIYEIDPSTERTHPIPKPNPSPYANVFLETLALPRTRPPTLRGTVLVRNLSFEKTVAVRFTLDDWQTTSEVLCKHVVSLPGLPPPFPRARTMGDIAATLASGQPAEEEKETTGPTWDRFSFTIRLEDYEAKLAERTLFLVVRYNPGCGGEWWDNNDGKNYRVGFRRAAASPLPSPSLSLGIAHSQQRTFSAPSTLKTTPTTGNMSPFPSSRQLAPPAPPQLTRSLSSPFPSMSPSFEEKERERLSERGLGSPTAAYLSKKLSFSNYVAPSANAMVTPPTTPPGTVRARSASLPAEVGLSADEPKENAESTKDENKNDDPANSGSQPILTTYRATIADTHPAFSDPTPASWAGPSSPSAASSTPPADSPLSSIPGPSAAALAAQSRSFGPSSYSGFAFGPHQLLSPPQSNNSSPSGSGTASPRRGSPEPRSQNKPSALGLERLTGTPPRSESPAQADEERKAAAALSSAVRELGLNNSLAATGANARVDTNDPSYAALLRQWCFAQSTPPGSASTPQGHASPSSSPSPRLASAVAAAAVGAVGMNAGGADSGSTTPKVGFGAGAGYGFPGFSFGLPDAGMVGGELKHRPFSLARVRWGMRYMQQAGSGRMTSSEEEDPTRGLLCRPQMACLRLARVPACRLDRFLSHPHCCAVRMTMG
ncbi:carbohydrate-binding module family 21 protein [Trametes coccinea BRFM310]|uniref:Carbohydrate-binding module family 21 protein n=1 Tax=Trametes coccinea (strain BRFM310) TaxID=1353009 RepID=A0A1Y2IL08_TRAC3|nr:carbohydrate-binding module family 21 protein [Trametes coccinea BRFM310]